MTTPAQILVATSDPHRQQEWSAALATVRCKVRQPGDGLAGEIDVVVTDQPLAQSGVTLDEDRLARGLIGMVAVGVPLPADVSLPLDCSPRELRLACLLLAEIIRLRRQREASRRKEKVLSHLAMSDPLTGLPNRRAWEQYLTERLTGEGEPASCCLALFDIDLFKALNDREGHVAGDEHLKDVAARLTMAVRRRNCVARLGGDEFAVLLEGVDETRASPLIERIRVQAGGIGAAGSDPLTLSAGWRCLTFPCGKGAIDEALQAADEALREAKASGRNRTCPGVSATPVPAA